MENRIYMSKLGEIRPYNEWKEWAIELYKSLGEPGYTDLPDNWFKRVERVLKLEEVLK